LEVTDQLTDKYGKERRYLAGKKMSDVTDFCLLFALRAIFVVLDPLRGGGGGGRERKKKGRDEKQRPQRFS
jgi:hypothetical protein